MCCYLYQELRAKSPADAAIYFSLGLTEGAKEQIQCAIKVEILE